MRSSGRLSGAFRAGCSSMRSEPGRGGGASSPGVFAPPASTFKLVVAAAALGFLAVAALFSPPLWAWFIYLFLLPFLVWLPGMTLHPAAGWALAAAALLMGGCSDGPTEPADLTGQWGAPHLALVLTEEGGTLEYDCAHGTIDPGWTVSDEGRFLGAGEHVQEHGVPIAEDEVVVPRPARYEGRLRGDNLRLTITLTDSARVVGTFDLKRGETGPVFKCL